MLINADPLKTTFINYRPMCLETDFCNLYTYVALEI